MAITVAGAFVAENLIGHVLVFLLLCEQLIQLVRISPILIRQVHRIDRALQWYLLRQANRRIVDVVASLRVQLGEDVVVEWLLLHN